jgi:hypothetical protein
VRAEPGPGWKPNAWFGTAHTEYLEADVPGAPPGRRGGGEPVTVPYRTGTMCSRKPSWGTAFPPSGAAHPAGAR